MRSWAGITEPQNVPPQQAASKLGGAPIVKKQKPRTAHKGAETKTKKVLFKAEPSDDKNEATADIGDTGSTPTLEQLEEALALEPIPSPIIHSGDEKADEPVGTMVETTPKSSELAVLTVDTDAFVQQTGLGVPINQSPPVCSKCRNPVDPLRCSGKSQGSWRCTQCNTKLSVLSRAFTHWPPPGFEQLSSDARAAFWQKSHKVATTQELRDLTISTVCATADTWQSTENDGEWLPLSVWANRGFDTDDIVRTATKDTMKDHQRWGKVYKVIIESDHAGSKRTLSLKDQLEDAPQIRRGTKKGKQEQPQPHAILDQESEPLSSSQNSATTTSSSSSSTSSAKHKKKPSKKDSKKKASAKKQEKKRQNRVKKLELKRKQEEKRRAAEDAERSRKDLKDKKAALALSRKAVAKLSVLHSGLKAVVEHPLARKCPQFAYKNASESLKKIGSCMDEATNVILAKKAHYLIRRERASGHLR